jgi:hypothetical protein
MEKLHMRSYNFGDIMTKLESTPLTDSDFERIYYLSMEQKTLVNKNGNIVKWTEKKAIELEKLIDRKNAKPELSKTAKTAIETLFKERVLNLNRLPLSTLPIEKGLLCEDSAIQRLGRILKIYLKKNEVEASDHIGTGVIDCKSKNVIFDTKCVYSFESMPLFDSKLESIYEWQMKRYLMMWDLKVGYVVKCLENHPQKVVDRLAQKFWYEDGNEGAPTDGFKNRIASYYNYDHLSDYQRTRFFKVELTDEDVAKINLHFDLANDYYLTLFEKNKQNNNYSKMIQL